MRVHSTIQAESTRHLQNVQTVQSNGTMVSQLVDTRPQQVAQRRLQESANNSMRASQLKNVQAKLSTQKVENDAPSQSIFETAQGIDVAQPLAQLASEEEMEQERPLQGNFVGTQHVPEVDVVQEKSDDSTAFQSHTQKGNEPNMTGLPNQLKAGIESLSGMRLDHVKVNYNSDKPAQLNAHAYVQGSEIHVAPGQEQHLPHETWHVVQQAQGRVKPTVQMKAGVSVNDDVGLEMEADVMGARAVQLAESNLDFFKQDKVMDTSSTSTKENQDKSAPEIASRNGGAIQKTAIRFKTPAVPTAEESLIINDANAIDALTDAAYLNTMNRLRASVAQVPEPLTFAMFPGAREGNFVNMIERLQLGNDALKAAAVGYVIEDQVTFADGLPGAAERQVNVGNAIPDFVITHGADGLRRQGIVDITSTGQIGHVLDKNFTIAHFPLVWESIYQSIDFTALGNGAVALAPDTAEMLENAKRRKANDYVRKRLHEIDRNLDLYYTGIKPNDKTFRIRGTRLSTFINQLPRDAGWTDLHIGVANNYIGDVNALLEPAFHLETLNHIILNAQNRYLLAGAPMW